MLMRFIMRDKKILILSTRPLDGALIEKAAFQKITIDTVSLINIKKHVTNEVVKKIELLSRETATVVFTSMNAVEILVELLPVNALIPHWNIYCIGGATFTLVKKYWPYDHVAYTAKDATELAQRIIADKIEKIVFFCGNKRREELPGLLQQANIVVDELIVYETIETPEVVVKNYDGILFFSPSAVYSYFSGNTPSEKTILFAIGNTTANAIKQFSRNSIIVSDFPAKDQLVDKALNYFSERAMLR